MSTTMLLAAVQPTSLLSDFNAHINLKPTFSEKKVHIKIVQIQYYI